MGSNKPVLKIRTDGGPEIGLGHVVRCISLAHMLTNDFSIHFFSLDIPKSFKKEIAQNGWDMKVIKRESDFLKELTGEEIVVLDGYQFDSDYQKEIKNRRSRLVCIDDFHDQYFYADLVINHAPGVNKEDYEGEPYTRYLLGPDYALLRPEFLERRLSDKKDDSRGIKNVFICFGGSDVKNLTAKILSWLPSKSYAVTVVLGNAYVHQDVLNKVIEERTDLEIVVKNSLNAKEMKHELEQTELAIVPASGISIETMNIGRPIISGYYTDNQLELYTWIREHGLIYSAGTFEKTEFLECVNCLNTEISKAMMEKQREVFDRKSSERIRWAIKDLSKKI